MAPFQVEELLVTVLPPGALEAQAQCVTIRGTGLKTSCESPSKKYCEDLPSNCRPPSQIRCNFPETGNVCDLPKTNRPGPKPRKKSPAKKKRASAANVAVDDLSALQAQLRAWLESGTAPS